MSGLLFLWSRLRIAAGPYQRSSWPFFYCRRWCRDSQLYKADLWKIRSIFGIVELSQTWRLNTWRFHKMEVPQNHGFQYSSSLILDDWGYPYFRKPPHLNTSWETTELMESPPGLWKLPSLRPSKRPVSCFVYIYLFDHIYIYIHTHTYIYIYIWPFAKNRWQEFGTNCW